MIKWKGPPMDSKTLDQMSIPLQKGEQMMEDEAEIQQMNEEIE